jgi:ribonuclease HII
MNFLIEESYKNLLVAGIDEAGRGPLAGPVVAACAILNQKFLQNKICKKINDSKTISKKQRQEIFFHLKKEIKFGVGIIDEKIIDKINILAATKLAMHQAYIDLTNKFQVEPQIILVDGNFVPFTVQDKIQQIIPIIRGDQQSLSIAAASIIAKETRDNFMLTLHQKYPRYNWQKNAGYPTKSHIEAINKFGICEFHRKSFAPCSISNKNF